MDSRQSIALSLAKTMDLLKDLTEEQQKVICSHQNCIFALFMIVLPTN